MKNLYILVICGLTMGLSSVFSQDQNPVLPKGAILRRAPDFASWTIQYEYKEKPSKEGEPAPYLGDRIRSLTITKTNKTYLEETVLASEKKFEKWVFDNVQLKSVPGSSAILPIIPPTADDPSDDYSDYSRSDFPEFGWISATNYTGVETYRGQRAFRFESDKGKALVSVETQLPIYLNDGTVSKLYSMQPAPTAPLSPPENFAKAFQTYKRAMEALKYRPVPL